MGMTTLGLKIDEERFVQTLQEAVGTLDSVEVEVTLDFFSVYRVDQRVLSAMEELVGVADDKNVKVLLCGVRVGVYRVLKLARLASRFSFVN